MKHLKLSKKLKEKSKYLKIKVKIIYNYFKFLLISLSPNYIRP